MKKLVLCGILGVMLCFVCTGCQRQTDLDAEEAAIAKEEEDDLEEVIEEEIVEEVVLQGDEEVTREYHFVLPDGWSVCKSKQSEQSSLEIQGNSDEQYAAVIVLEEELLLDLDVMTYMNRYLEEVQQSYEDVEISEIENFMAHSGSAHKVSFEGTVGGKVYINFLYVVEAQEHWYITTACSFVSKAADLEKDMDEFAASFYKVETVLEETTVQENETIENPSELTEDTDIETEDTAILPDETSDSVSENP